MKNSFFFLLVIFLGIMGCAGLRSSGSGAGEFYEGFGSGYRGPIQLRVQIGPGGDIRGIEILEHGEDPLVGAYAMEELLEAVLSTGSVDIDGISGATESSAGFLEAVEDALARVPSS
jgi:urocanate reductase